MDDETPPAGPSTEGERVLRLVVRGRLHRSQRALALLAGLVVVGVVAWGAARMFGESQGAPESVWAGAVWVAVVLTLTLAFLARRTAASVRPVRRPSEEAAAGTPTATGGSSTGGVIVCCSGGGVKSASFCMGALQRLRAEAGEWDDVEAVVGVSGGGYMASAWAVATHRAALAATEMGWSAEQLQALRARTNYLASSGRARFDLTCSFLFGIVLNVILLAGPLVTVAWLVGGYAVDAGLAGRDAPDPGWAQWWLFAPSLLLVALAVVIFMSQRFGWGSGRLGARVGALAVGIYWWLVAGRRAADDAAAGRDGRPAVDVREETEDSERLRFLAEAPNTLVGAALGYAVAVPVLIWTATHYRDVVTGTSGILEYYYEQKDRIAWGLAVLGGMAGLSHSGARATGPTSGPVAVAWRLFRQRVAPWVAVLIIAAFAYWLAALLTAREMAAPLTGWWAAAAASAVVVLPSVVGLIGSANATSIFQYYCDRLAYAYLGPACEDERVAAGLPAASADAVTLAQVTARPSRPQLVLMATANASGAGYLPTGRNGVPFVMSAEVGYPGRSGPYPRATEAAGDYLLERGLPITVAEAMAVSGAAVSPQAGRESKNLGGYRVLLALANVRLGAWAPNPYCARLAPAVEPRAWRRALLGLDALLNRHTALHVVQEAFGALRLDTPYVYLTDGGHYDNLGLVEALRRRPARIYVLDGSGDAEDTFAAVGDAMATARMDLGVEVAFRHPHRMMRGSAEHPDRAWTTMSATATDDPDWVCDIVYVKAVLPKGFSFDLYAFQERNPGFPTELGRIEMLDEFDFEAYRQLGCCAMDSALAGRADR